MDTGVFLSTTTLQSLSPATLSEILTALGKPSNDIPLAVPSEDGHIFAAAAAGDAVDITAAQARKIIADPLNEKTRNTLRAIAELGPKFGYKQLATSLGLSSISDLQGVWAAITRRTRNVLNDRAARLIYWIPDTAEWENEEYVDEQGSVTPQTRAALRQAFNLV